MNWVNVLAVAALWLLVPIATAVAAGHSDRGRRLLIALTIFSFAWAPLTTIDYQFGTRYNARGWEFCLAEMLATGLLLARLRAGIAPIHWLSPVVALWTLHLAALLTSAVCGIDTTLSLWYCWRMARGLLVMMALVVAIRDRRDFEAVLAGLILTCLWNEWYVIRQKYWWGAWQAHGAFDHQNAMSMYMILCGTTLFAAWMFRAASAPLRWPLLVGILCSAHGVFAGLSRGSMLFYSLTMAATAGTALALAPDRHKLRAVALIGAIGLVGGALVAPSVIERFNDRGNPVSERTREVMISVAQEMHDDRPWLGLGPNNYALAVNYSRYSHLADIIARERGYNIGRDVKRGQIESLYWGMRAEGGDLGLLTLIAFMIATVVALGAKAITVRDPLSRGMTLGVCFALSANYLQCRLEHTLLHPQNLYLWLGLVAIGVAVPWRRPIPGGVAALAPAATDPRPGPTPAPATLPAGTPFWT